MQSSICPMQSERQLLLLFAVSVCDMSSILKNMLKLLLINIFNWNIPNIIIKIKTQRVLRFLKNATCYCALL